MEMLIVSCDDLQIVLTHFTLGVRSFRWFLYAKDTGRYFATRITDCPSVQCSPSNSNCTMYIYLQTLWIEH